VIEAIRHAIPCGTERRTRPDIEEHAGVSGAITENELITLARINQRQDPDENRACFRSSRMGPAIQK